MLAGIAIILYCKLYILIDISYIVGIYSFLSTSMLLGLLILGYFKFTDPFDKVKNLPHLNPLPLVSIVIAVKNEEDNIRSCIESCINCTYEKKEIIVVNDGSTDQTTEILLDMKKYYDSLLNVIFLSESLGKKKAIELASNISKGEIYAFMDSDCNMRKDAIENAVKIFQYEPALGALTAHGIVKQSKNNLLLKIQGVWFDGQFRLIKGMESSYCSLTCCSGALSLFRREAIQPFFHDWAHDTFFGVRDFKYATDRRLTAYVLGADKVPLKEAQLQIKSADSNISSRTCSPISQFVRPERQVGCSDISLENTSVDNKNTDVRSRWKVMYSPSVKVDMGVPETFLNLLTQQIRWKKSFIRSIFCTGKIYWRRPVIAALVYYLETGLRLFRPFVIIQALFVLPFLGDYFAGLFYLTGTLFSGMIYGIDFKLRHPESNLWTYRPLMTFLSTFVFVWLLIYAAITIKKSTKWR